MNTVTRVVVGLLLVAHGLVHLLYLVAEPGDKNYPFTLRESWLVPESTRRPLAIFLIVATIVLFTLLALAVWGVPGLSGLWPVLAIVAALSSLALLIAFWNPRLIIGVGIDVALIVIAVIRPGWTDVL
jgi:hypothetical protein